jgi:CRISPR-associated protein Cas5d
MTARYPPLCVKVWGDLACFTRPEMKVERVSYAAPTASAARGILEAIFWKQEFIWRVEEVWVLRPIRYFSILRNEVNSRANQAAAARRLEGGAPYDAAEDRTQRHTLALRDVAYVIKAQVELQPWANADEAKYRDQFRRRVAAGRCFATPYLGCREFSAAFGEPAGVEQPIDRTEDLGPMLLDLIYEPPDSFRRPAAPVEQMALRLPGGVLTNAQASGRATPQFFDARLERGVLRFPTPARAPLKEG